MIDPTDSIIEVYDTIADAYVAKYGEDSTDKSHVNLLLKKLPYKAEILDAGCGAGQNAYHMAKKGFRVTGVDLSRNMLAIAKNHYSNCTFVYMDIRRLQFPPNKFNGILSSYSLIHISDTKVSGVLSDFYRILKSGGWVAIFAQQGKPDHYVDEPFAPGKKTFFNFFTKKRITEKLKEVGFSSITIQSEHCDDKYNMSDTNLYIFAKK
ncbi:MAG TPA: methyltransferase domain-containing protein [Patescibacteria group bacterium]|nr:methyltransferase domain-containing protein [Patescibacteria group bacterium]